MSITNVPTLVHNTDLNTKDKVVKAGLLVLQLMQTAPTIKLIEQCIKNGGGVIGSETIRKFMPEVYREVSNAMRISQNLSDNGLPEDVLKALHSIMAFSADSAQKNLTFELDELEKNKSLMQEQVDEANQQKQLKDSQFELLKLQYDQLKENYNVKLVDNQTLQNNKTNMDEQFKSLNADFTQEKHYGEVLSQTLNESKLTIVKLESQLSDSLLSNTHLKTEAIKTIKELHKSKDSNEELTKQNQLLKDSHFELKFKLTNKETEIQNLMLKVEKIESTLKAKTLNSEAKLELVIIQSEEKTESLITQVNQKNTQIQEYRDKTVDQKSVILVLTEKMKLSEQHNEILIKSEAQALKLMQKFNM
ncbi:MAG: hypothetical protein HRU38_13970 [Saccharospirillaceae bacterium]|nr:hypothetical protein [Pseudomonadales bacterium]NRB79753.1 hypothetical protein [Saccharospirillaceae bacterium]